MGQKPPRSDTLREAFDRFHAEDTFEKDGFRIATQLREDELYEATVTHPGRQVRFKDGSGEDGHSFQAETKEGAVALAYAAIEAGDVKVE